MTVRQPCTAQHISCAVAQMLESFFMWRDHFDHGHAMAGENRADDAGCGAMKG
jgi:hypothetical protein